MSVTAMAQPASGPTYAPQPLSCGEIPSDFQALALDFIKHWKGETEFCEFKRFTRLNEMTAEDMSLRPAQYHERMAFLHSQALKNPEPVNYLLLSFQETWFDTYIDKILLEERGRSGVWSRWLTIGAAGSIVALLALPFTKRYSSKPFRLFQTGLKHFLQKRVITFGSTSIGSQWGRLTPDRGDKKPPETFVSPPLYYGAEAEILDERTYQIFLSEIRDDVISATSGVLGGWFLGHGASVVVRDRVAKSWGDTALGRFAWSTSKPVKFASPGMIAGFAVTIVATNAISDMTSDILFQKKFNDIRGKLDGELSSLVKAVARDDEFVIFSKVEKIRNDLTLQDFILTHELTESLVTESEEASQRLLNSFAFCMEPRERILSRAKVHFFERITKLIREKSRDLKAALLLVQTAQETLLSHPHPMTKALTGANDKLMMRSKWLLDSAVTAQDLWADIEAAVKDQPVDCVDLSGGLPL